MEDRQPLKDKGRSSAAPLHIICGLCSRNVHSTPAASDGAHASHPYASLHTASTYVLDSYNPASLPAATLWVPFAQQTFRGPAETRFAQTSAGLYPETSTALRLRQTGLNPGWRFSGFRFYRKQAHAPPAKPALPSTGELTACTRGAPTKRSRNQLHGRSQEAQRSRDRNALRRRKNAFCLLLGGQK
jgi:hypothetical protein